MYQIIITIIDCCCKYANGRCRIISTKYYTILHIYAKLSVVRSNVYPSNCPNSFPCRTGRAQLAAPTHSGSSLSRHHARRGTDVSIARIRFIPITVLRSITIGFIIVINRARRTNRTKTSCTTPRLTHSVLRDRRNLNLVHFNLRLQYVVWFSWPFLHRHSIPRYSYRVLKVFGLYDERGRMTYGYHKTGVRLTQIAAHRSWTELPVNSVLRTRCS